MSIQKAEELLNTAIIHIRILEERLSGQPNFSLWHFQIKDALNALLDAKEELKDYKL